LALQGSCALRGSTGEGREAALAARGGAALSEPLPELLDARRLQVELGVSRAAAEAIMRRAIGRRPRRRRHR